MARASARAGANPRQRVQSGVAWRSVARPPQRVNGVETKNICNLSWSELDDLRRGAARRHNRPLMCRLAVMSSRRSGQGSEGRGRGACIHTCIHIHIHRRSYVSGMLNPVSTSQGHSRAGQQQSAFEETQEQAREVEEEEGDDEITLVTSSLRSFAPPRQHGCTVPSRLWIVDLWLPLRKLKWGRYSRWQKGSEERVVCLAIGWGRGGGRTGKPPHSRRTEN